MSSRACQAAWDAADTCMQRSDPGSNPSVPGSLRVGCAQSSAPRGEGRDHSAARACTGRQASGSEGTVRYCRPVGVALQDYAPTECSDVPAKYFVAVAAPWAAAAVVKSRLVIGERPAE